MARSLMILDNLKRFKGQYPRILHDRYFHFLCTGASFMHLTSFLVISNKFWIGGRVGWSTAVMSFNPLPNGPRSNLT